MTASATGLRYELDLPAGLCPEPIVVRDPFLEFLGLVARARRLP